ncbi:MAG: nitrogen fixation protein NifB [Rhodocyclaceae bacterium]|nr:MAG: nitrogen fixation protein NifB [Rhodocyclaceae bacterium]
MIVDLPVIAPEAPQAGGCSAGSCGSSADQMGGMSDEIRARVQDHPCYSEDAHHYFARMHVAVAPACNIQCHYCNRKYDCANESRPGVVSELLTPDQAVKKTLAVAATIPQMTVLGIAGPGDPLANPERTFETFRQLAAKAPDIKLCVSTNGLSLPDNVEELAKHNIDHVTITINCVDPDVGAKIYPWIFWQNKRIHGREAAEILIAQQQKGLEMLVAKGILVKVNSVLIPGVNDEHLKEVSKIVKAKGAFLHNVMPLIAENLQDACEGDMNMMRHCRQCRADAVGLLGEDRGDEFTMDKIEAMDIDYEAAMTVRAELRAKVTAELEAKRQKAHAPPAPQVVQFMPRPHKSAQESAPAGRRVLMAVAAKGGLVAVHFGHAKEFLVYEASADGAKFVGHRKAEQYCAGDETCGDGESVLDRTIKALEGCEVVLCSKIGFEPWGNLEAAGIAPNGEHAMEPIEEAVMAVWNEMLAAGKLDAKPSAAKCA